MPLYPRIATSQGAYPNSLYFRCFHLGFIVESIKEFGGASLAHYKHMDFLGYVKCFYMFFANGYEPLNVVEDYTWFVATLALGSRPRQRLTKLQAKSEPRVTFHVPMSARKSKGMNPHIPK